MIALAEDGSVLAKGAVSKIFMKRGMELVVVNEVAAGDICTIAGNLMSPSSFSSMILPAARVPLNSC